MNEGKKKQRSVPLPEGWWLRLVAFCEQKWKHSPTDVFDIYQFTGVSRRTFSDAQRKGRITESTFAALVGKTGCDSPDQLLAILGLSSTADGERKRSAERRWQLIQHHPIRGIEVRLLLKAAVEFDWFRELLADARIGFSRNEKSYPLGQLLTMPATPNTEERAPTIDHLIYSFWEIYEPEDGFWVRKIAQTPRVFSTVSGIDAVIPWSLLGVSDVEKLSDLGLKNDIGVSLPPRAFRVGVEEFEMRFVGDTFSFSLKLSEHGIDALHEFARQARGKLEINFGTHVDGMHLLETFYDQLLPQTKQVSPKRASIFEGLSGPNGRAISFYPGMPPGFDKSEESREYSFTISVPAEVNYASQIEILERKLNSRTTDSNAYGRLAALYSKTGRQQDAIRCLEAAFKKVSPTAELHGLMAQLLMQVGRTTEAVKHLQKAASLDPKHALVQTKLAICLGVLGKHDEARAHFENAARLEPSNAGYQFNLGMELGRAEKYSDAEAAFRQTAILDPKNAQAMTLLGVILKRAGRNQEATDWFEKAVTVQPDFDEAQEMLGRQLAEMGAHEKAIDHLKRAIEQKEDAARQTLLAASLSALERWTEAEDSFKRALVLDPDQADNILNLAIVQSHRNAPSEALATCERAVKTGGGARAVGFLGQLLGDLDRWNDAANAYKRAIEIEPENAAIWANYGIALANTGELSKAKEALEASLRADGANEHVAAALAVVNEKLKDQGVS